METIFRSLAEVAYVLSLNACYLKIWRCCRIEVPYLYSIEFRGKRAMKKLSMGNYMGKHVKNIKKLIGDSIEFREENSMELPWNTTGLRGVLMRYRPRKITLETFSWKCRIAKISQVRPSSVTAVYPHMPILRPHAARFHERRISSAAFGLRAP